MRNDSLQEFIKLHRQLTEEKASLEKRLQQINEALGEMSSAPSAPSSPSAARAGKKGSGKRQMSAEARARIAEAQRRRWAAQKGGTVSAAESNGKPKRKMSAAGRKAISEAAKRRWAAARAAA